MANKPKSIYLTEETMRLVRRSDSLSARVNQIADRYALLLLAHRTRVQAHIRDDDLRKLAAEWQGDASRLDLAKLEAELRDAAERVGHHCWGGFMRLEPVDLVALVELLESMRDELAFG